MEGVPLFHSGAATPVFDACGVWQNTQICCVLVCVLTCPLPVVVRLCGVVLAGALMARAAAVAEAALGAQPGDAFYLGKLATCRFYAEQVLPEAAGLARIVKGGAASVTEVRPELL